MRRFAFPLLYVSSLIVTVAALAVKPAAAQGYRGRDFWVCFPENAVLEGPKVLQLAVYITSESRTTGKISAPFGDAIPFSIEAGSSISIDLDSALQLYGSGAIEKKGIHITSNNEVSVYAVSHRAASTDSYGAIPTEFLGKEYIVAGYDPLFGSGIGFTSECAVLATQDTTLVTIHLSAPTDDGAPAGRTISLVMNKGMAYELQGDAHANKTNQHDLTGTTIIADKPVAFVTGHRCAQVPADQSYCDVLLEMEPPSNDWGTDFILTKFAGKDYYAARVMAKDDGTEVLLNGTSVAKLRRGEYYKNDHIADDAVVRTTKPVLVAQYGTSSSADSIKIGDPFMLLVTPNDRFIHETTTTSVTAGGFYHDLNIVVPDSGIATLTLDGAYVGLGRPIVGSKLLSKRPISSARSTIFSFEVAPGRHLVQCAAPVAVYSYGFGVGSDNYDSYGHACGQRLDATTK